MGKDYYSILGIGKDADAEAIKKAYRKQALKWHPDRHPDKSEAERKDVEAKFKDIAEAYDVLSDPQKKQIYDQVGEEGLKGGGMPGGSDGSGGMPGHPHGFSYQFHGDPNDIFARFFKDSFQRSSSFGESPFDGMGGLFGGFGGGMPGMGGPFGAMGAKGGGKGGGMGGARPAVFELACSLEELYKGATKKMKVKRSSTTLQRDPEAVLEIEVKPGWKAGTKVTFAGEGDEIGNTGRAQDVVFVIREKKHGTFTREGSNLLHHARIPLVDALTGFKIDVPSLDNRILRVNVRDMVTPSYTKIVRGEGMPSTKTPDTKGDLIITFDVFYPRSIDESAREQLKSLLPRA